MDTNGKRDFKGKVAFVTGGGNGIGRAAALAFARQGASVVVADVSENGNRETFRMIEEQGGRALAVRCDVTRVEDLKAALDKTVEAFGRLDFAFNNAGIEPRKPAPTADYDLEEWEPASPFVRRVSTCGVSDRCQSRYWIRSLPSTCDPRLRRFAYST